MNGIVNCIVIECDMEGISLIATPTQPLEHV